MKKEMCFVRRQKAEGRRQKFFVFLFLLCFGFVSAAAVNVSIIDDAGECSGAYLQVKASESGELGEKIYPDPSKHLKDAGIFKFEVETSLAEAFFNVVFTKDGTKINEVSKGPFDINGSEIVVDLRVIEELEVIKSVEVEVNESELNETNETIVEVEVESEDGENSLVEMTGRVMQNVGDYNSIVYYSIGGVLLLVIVIVFIMLFRKRKKDVLPVEEDVTDEDDKELEAMEKKLADTEKKIGALKELEKKRGKLMAAKRKLAEEEDELRRLQRGGSEKEIEKQKKEVRAAEERIEDIDSF